MADAASRVLDLVYSHRSAEADSELCQQGFQMRYSDEVLRQQHAPGSDVMPAGSVPCTCLDNVLPQQLTAALGHALRPDAPFWTEHQYGEGSEYFSYWHDLKCPDGTLMEQAADYVRQALLPFFPALSSATKLEWWAHKRDHSFGHQLHWDSDSEGYPVVLNPIASAVVYLCWGVGGPTVVTPQLLTDDCVAKHGWCIYPPSAAEGVGRIASFDGRVLHGVVGGAPSRRPADQRKRTTLMFAFWRDVKMRPSLTEQKGACRPLPSPSQRYTFVREITPQLHLDRSAAPVPVPVPVTFVAPFFSFTDPNHVGDAMVPYESVFQGL